MSLNNGVSCFIFEHRTLNVPATPQSPNPELRIVEPLRTSATASSAVPYTLEYFCCDCENRTVVVIKVRFEKLILGLSIRAVTAQVVR